MPAIACDIAGCVYRTADVDNVVAAVMLGHHYTSAHPAPIVAKAPVIPQPKVVGNIYEDTWDSFQREWTAYKDTVAIPANKVSIFLLACCSIELKHSVEASDPTISTKVEADVMATIKRHAVVSVAASVLRTELFAMKQDHGETILAFSSRAMGKARNCKLSVKCTCNADVDYSEQMVKQVLLAGMYDDDIKRKALSTVGIDNKSLNDTIAIVETEEMASRSMSGQNTSSFASATSYKKVIQSSDKRLQTKGKCVQCDSSFHNSRVKKVAGKEDIILTDRYCKQCWQKRFEDRQSKRPTSKPDSTEASAVAETRDFPYLLCSVTVGKQTSTATSPVSTVGAAVNKPTNVPISNYIFDGTKGWMERPAEPHPVVTLTVSIEDSDYKHMPLPSPKMKPTKCSVITDSGCQSSLLGLSTLHKFGLNKSALVPVKGTMSAINGEGINIVGAIFLRLTGTDTSTGRAVQTAVMANVSDSTDQFYISHQAMRELGIIPPDFPKIQANTASIAAAESELAPCSCPKHALPPARPDRLPFAPTEENVDKMRAWLLERFSSSTFNRCPHQPLPMMKGDPIKIHIDPQATPKAVFTAATVPIHWREDVQAQLDQDVALGIIERVSDGVPTTWQARMHVVAKHDGTPRRTVDLRALNANCVRETQHVIPPYKQARLVPAGGFRTVTDCWNGYHSCPLAEEDRHLTTFITEWGRYQYCAAPQGFLAAGDGYNQRYDNIIADVPRKTKCVDDVVMWDDGLEEHWWRIIDYLSLVGKNGIIMNPKKFQFCQKTVEFAGFVLTQEDVKPLPKYLDAIRDFPRPSNISEIRSWFGLVNQVSHYAKLTSIMAPFKPLLSPKTRFQWDDDMEWAFQQSKLEIIKAIEEGVKIFDPSRTTALSPDWSKTGIGYFLYQKYCQCPSTTTMCCNNGWRITVAGSRFLHKAEQNYWPVEGEALAVAWSLEDTKFFTLGCGDLHVQTDHRPLVKLLGDRTLDEIDNRRLINLKEKTMSWRFEIHHVPGRLIPAPDATSRNPHDRSGVDQDTDLHVQSGALSAIRRIHDVDDMEACVVAAARSAMPAIQAVTWERVRDETSRDIQLLQLIELAEHGFPNSSEKMSPQTIPYWRLRDSLSAVDGVLMYGSRVVIPAKLQDEVCAHLHSAHQGVSQMTNRANECVFWPGITSDIQAARAKCSTCDVNAPSQSKMPASDPFVPNAPFQAVATDYFQLEGKRYLLTVDRFSNWSDLREAPAHTADSGSHGLIKAYRDLFATFGVPEQLSSDGGPEYTSGAFQSFLKTWGVKHRLSSAYHPQSNGRAEVTVKAMKRLLRDNVDHNGTINTDAVTRGILQLRNTPENDCGLSPAQILLGRTLRDCLPLRPPIPLGSTVFKPDSDVQQEWKDAWSAKEFALRKRLARQVEKIDEGSHILAPLSTGDTVRIQNQTGHYPNKWDKTGSIVEVGQHDQYLIRVDGSRRITTRNRRFIRKLSSHSFIPQSNTPSTHSQTIIPQPDVSSQQSEQVTTQTFSQTPDEVTNPTLSHQPDAIARQPDQVTEQTISQPHAPTSAQKEAPSTPRGQLPLSIPEIKAPPVARAIIREWVPSRPQRNRRAPDMYGNWVKY